jgi:hypothetical protein
MKKTKLPSLVTILILTLITVVVWVTFDVYRLFNKADDPVVPESVSAPLVPTFDSDAINQFRSRINLNDSEIPDQVTGPTIQSSANTNTVTVSP